jgi:hypothetical protein
MRRALGRRRPAPPAATRNPRGAAIAPHPCCTRIGPYVHAHTAMPPALGPGRPPQPWGSRVRPPCPCALPQAGAAVAAGGGDPYAALRPAAAALERLAGVLVAGGAPAREADALAAHAALRRCGEGGRGDRRACAGGLSQEGALRTPGQAVLRAALWSRCALLRGTGVGLGGGGGPLAGGRAAHRPPLATAPHTSHLTPHTSHPPIARRQPGASAVRLGSGWRRWRPRPPWPAPARRTTRTRGRTTRGGARRARGACGRRHPWRRHWRRRCGYWLLR